MTTWKLIVAALVTAFVILLAGAVFFLIVLALLCGLLILVAFAVQVAISQ